jgi:NADH pyrophosphatase NudC (nudix superfamily)
MADFFDKIMHGASRGITTVSVKSKEALETATLKGRIGTLQTQRRHALEELGNIVYTMFLKGTFIEERIKVKCDAIRGLDKEIQETEEKISQIHLSADTALGKPRASGICECGAKIYELDRFCGKCGKKVEVGSGS